MNQNSNASEPEPQPPAAAPRFISWLHKTENFLAVIAILLLAFFPFVSIFARFFRTAIPHSTPYTQHLVLLVTFIGAMITSREKKHLSLSIQWNIGEPLKSRIQALLMFLSAMVTTAFCWSALSFIFVGFEASKKVGIFPIRLVAMVMVIGYAVMAVRFVTATPKKSNYRKFAWFGILLGTLIALGSISNAVEAIFGTSPAFMETLVSFNQSFNGFIGLPVVLLLIAGGIFGAPIFVVLGGIAYMLFALVEGPLMVIPNEAYVMLTSHEIPSIALFTVAGFILSESKAGERLVEFFKAVFGWFPGGLAVMAILVCAFFTTFTGASGVTILALGALLSYVLTNGKYDRKFSVGLLTASGSVGLLFPPSLPIIIYGVVAGISIKKMFIGGIIPGILMVSVMVIYSIIYASRHKTQREPFKMKVAFKSVRGAIWELLLPVVIVMGYFGGLTTLVESAAIAVVYALFVEMVIHRDLRIRDLSGVIMKCIPIIGGVLIILSLANGLEYYLVDAEIPMKLTEWVQANISSKYVFLLLLNLALLVTGCLMDIFSAIMVVVPLIIPLGELFGIHPVHLGIIFLANMELGYMTPPVGLNLFLSSYRFNEPMSKLYRDVLPFLLIQLIAVLLITYVPFFTTFLVGLVN